VLNRDCPDIDHEILTGSELLPHQKQVGLQNVMSLGDSPFRRRFWRSPIHCVRLPATPVVRTTELRSRRVLAIPDSGTYLCAGANTS
jgi:hypothetical protein